MWWNVSKVVLKPRRNSDGRQSELSAFFPRVARQAKPNFKKAFPFSRTDDVQERRENELSPTRYWDFIYQLFDALIIAWIMQATDLLVAFNAGLNSSSSEQLCVFFARGKCRNGSTCRFSHKSSSLSSQDVAHREATRDPDMRQCKSIEELVQSAHEHLDTISPRGMAAFWSLLVKHAHKQDEKSRAQFNEQLDALLARTLQILGQFSGRHLATTVLSLVKL